MRYLGYGLVAGGCLMGLVLCVTGCGGEKSSASATQREVPGGFRKFVSPKEIPTWLVIRQINQISHHYNLTVEEAADQIIDAIRSTGGTVRYGTITGKARTIYARTAEGEAITIDVDPVRRKPGEVKVDICVGMYGNKVQEKEIYQAMAATPIK